MAHPDPEEIILTTWNPNYLRILHISFFFSDKMVLKENKKNVSIFFSIIYNYLPLKNDEVLYFQNSVSPLLRSVKFGWNWLSGSGEDVENV